MASTEKAIRVSDAVITAGEVAAGAAGAYAATRAVQGKAALVFLARGITGFVFGAMLFSLVAELVPLKRK